MRQFKRLGVIALAVMAAVLVLLILRLLVTALLPLLVLAFKLAWMVIVGLAALKYLLKD